mmetsp:Transcript_18651/g.52071  ORF Transcript_18651/g.52071 Transcript_18651/m.52071 type:complete len:163 (-) Transcript_18651:133-621(-)
MLAMGIEVSTVRCCCAQQEGDADGGSGEPLVVHRVFNKVALDDHDVEFGCRLLESQLTRVPPVSKVLPELEQPLGEVFSVTLVKTPGGSLGIDVNHADQRTLRVVNLSALGLIPAWNSQHLQHRVEVGDRIVSVNGIEGSAAQMIEACKAAAQLHLMVHRGG